MQSEAAVVSGHYRSAATTGQRQLRAELLRKSRELFNLFKISLHFLFSSGNIVFPHNSIFLFVWGRCFSILWKNTCSVSLASDRRVSIVWQQLGLCVFRAWPIAAMRFYFPEARGKNIWKGEKMLIIVIINILDNYGWFIIVEKICLKYKIILINKIDGK